MSTKQRNGRWRMALILTLGGMGVWVSGELVKQQADLWNQRESRAGWLSRLCQATEWRGFDCAVTAKSRWSQFELPVPVSAGGLTFGMKTVTIPVAFLGLAYFVFLVV